MALPPAMPVRRYGGAGHNKLFVFQKPDIPQTQNIQRLASRMDSGLIPVRGWRQKKSDIWRFHTKPTNIRSIRKPLSRCQIKEQKSYLQKKLSKILVYVVKPFFYFFPRNGSQYSRF
jgi:hypothetical protein